MKSAVFQKAKQTLKTEWHIVFITILFAGTLFYLQLQQHNAFNSRIGDFARFSQAIWSVLDGKFLFSPIPAPGRSIMGDHFSPIMILAAPFLLIWPDERALFIVQTINLTATGLILYIIIKGERPNLAPWLLLLFFLNPALHDFSLADFRRIFFGLPWMALAMLGLARQNRKLLLLGLLVALLSKETVALYIAMIGLYLLVAERDWKWGIGLFIFGGVALITLSEYIIPAFSGAETYPQLFYYDHLGDSYGEIIRTMLTRPVWMIQQILGPNQLWGLFRILLPLGFLCFLAPRVTLICAPFAILMFISGRPNAIRLEEHYTALMLPILFTAIIIGVRRLSPKWDKWLIGWMMGCVLVSFLWFSHWPLGGYYQAGRFHVDDHKRAGAAITKRVPEDVNLLAHTTYTPHLTHVDNISVFLHGDEGTPFSEDRMKSADYIFIDRKVSQPNLGAFETEGVVQELLANPTFKIIEENDGIFFLQQTPSNHPATQTNVIFGKTMHLEKVELATSNVDGFYTPLTPPYIAQAGATLRISLFWESLTDGAGERTVSTRLSAFDGFLLTQHDQIPAEAKRPTAFWQKGEKIRDIYYLTIPPERIDQTITLDLVVYDTFEKNIFQVNGSDIYQVTSIQIE